MFLDNYSGGGINILDSRQVGPGTSIPLGMICKIAQNKHEAESRSKQGPGDNMLGLAS